MNDRLLQGRKLICWGFQEGSMLSYGQQIVGVAPFEKVFEDSAPYVTYISSQTTSTVSADLDMFSPHL